MGIKNINLNGVQEQLVSGTNIKTVNGTSLLGSGNISTASGFQGTIVIADTPATDGIYRPTEEGTYTNAGGLTYLPSTTDEGYQVEFVLNGGVWVKSRVASPFTDKANQLTYDFNTSELIFGGFGTDPAVEAGNTSTLRLKSKDIINLPSSDFEVLVNSPDGIVLQLIKGYLDGVFVYQVGTSNTFTIDNSTYNGVRLAFKKPDNSTITPSELEAVDVKILSKSYIGYDLIQYDIKELKESNSYFKYNWINTTVEFGGYGIDGLEVDNLIRLRTEKIVEIEDGDYKLILKSNYGLINNITLGYLNGAVVQNWGLEIKEFTINSNLINGLRFSFKKPDNSIITEIELNDLEVYLFSNENGYQKIQTEIVRLNKKTSVEIGNKWEGKKFTILGDSISYGFIPRNYTGYPGQLNSYAKITAERLGMSFINKGISGSTLGAKDTVGNTANSPFVYRYEDILDNQDLIVVMGGTNDIRKINNLGTFTDTDETSYYGALHFLCLGLIEKFRVDQGTTEGTKKHIVFCTPIKLGVDLTPDLRPYCEAIKEVCAYYSIPVWDAYNLSGINPHIFRTIVGTEVGYTDNYNPYITDGTHPTQEGHEIIATAFIGFLNTIL